jgi:type IV pilus assembly protein PilA
MYAHFRRQRGFTLVELMLVVMIVGVLAALAVYGVQRYVANAKTAEARNAVGQISKDAQSAFAYEHMSTATPLASSESAKVSNRLCPPGPPVPAAVPAAEKVQSEPAAWTGGWKCLRFSMTEPQNYQYTYSTDATDTETGTYFEAIAQGDVDGDGAPSTFKLRGEVQQDTKALFVAPTISETDPEE